MGTENMSKSAKKHLEHVRNYMAKAIHQYNMIVPDDKILVAVSGGKDSLVMLEGLVALQQFGDIRFELEGIHIQVSDVPYQIDELWLNELAGQLGIKIHTVQIEAGLERRGKKAPCFVCSWHRRKALFTFAKSHGFNSVALGHHMDDAVETLIINMTYHANVSSLPGKLSMFDGALFLIRPLILLTDADTMAYAKIKQYPPLKNECPYEDKTRRTTARQLIKNMEVIHPKAKQNLFNSLQHIDNEYLP